MNKFVYSFNEGNKDMRELLGGKGANLSEMVAIGLPVPKGFVITTEACNKYYSDDKKIDETVLSQIFEYLDFLEEATEKRLGDPSKPLLVSVRSGAPASMPGMMDTILNLGLNDEVAQGMIKLGMDKRFVYDSYRRFIMMFADVVMGYDRDKFEGLLDELKKARNVTDDIALDADDMYKLTLEYKDLYLELNHEEFPVDPKKQLILAVEAVFRSWNNDRAIVYRQMNDIPSSWGTAVNVQEMVYGNLGENSGTGVAFTRNPATGANELFGEYLINAQGEDVVAGVRTPKSIDTLSSLMPDVYNQFLEICGILEHHYKDMQDMEFTIENGKLFMLQTRNAKRTGQAAVKVSVDMVYEGLISKEEAILRVDANSIDQLLHETFDKDELENARKIGNGLAASPGAGCGKIYFEAKDVSLAKERGEDAVLVRLETSPEDIEGMRDARGVLTIRGGMTSHAAVVARGMGRCCVSGCGNMMVDVANKTLTTKDGEVLKEGDFISIDGSTGMVYAGKIKTASPTISGEFKTFMEWVDDIRRLKVRTNADTPKDAKQAKEFGAEGIGLCRTEHMFFDKERIFNFRKMIIADNREDREAALKKILPYQRDDFEKLFETMDGLPVIIRYLDPPLHEFLPKTNDEINKLANSLKIDFATLKLRIDSLKEFNPMMGHRGCRLAITYPEIAVMQTQAVIEAAINVMRKGIKVTPEIMIPLVGDIKELKYVKDIVCKVADKIISENGIDIEYQVGTMIEIPRACLVADTLAREADFFSFGTNDLTQLTYGFSRDDANKYINDYKKKKIIETDPFASIDREGVGKMVNLAIKKARSVNENISLGICGEHGGDVKSIEFFNHIGLDYVSCSPYRVPIARVAAAQASIRESQSK